MMKKENFKLEAGWSQGGKQDFWSNFISFKHPLANDCCMPSIDQQTLGYAKINSKKMVLDPEELTYSLEGRHINK